MLGQKHRTKRIDAWTKVEKLSKGKVRYSMKGVRKIDTKKRFPTDEDLVERSTFLNDKKINGELYAYLQKISSVEDKTTTVVYKTQLNKTKAGVAIGKSAKTVGRYINIMIDKKVIEEKEDKYVLPSIEDTYILIPLETIQYLTDTVNEYVVKVYIYLGKKYKWKSKKGERYIFDRNELMNMLGIGSSNSRDYERINNILIALVNNGFIKYAEVMVGQQKRLVLTDWSESYKCGQNK